LNLKSIGGCGPNLELSSHGGRKKNVIIEVGDTSDSSLMSIHGKSSLLVLYIVVSHVLKMHVWILSGKVNVFVFLVVEGEFAIGIW
jgi:hypothetical protein